MHEQARIRIEPSNGYDCAFGLWPRSQYLGTLASMATLDSQLEAVLFQQAEPMSRAKLQEILDATKEDLDMALHTLETALGSRGIRLLLVGDHVELVTAPDVSSIITKLRDKELQQELGRAASETLSIILYRSPISRAEIEYVRGVSCAFVLRNLLIRGLIERIPSADNARIMLYQETPSLLASLGVTKKDDLPDYTTLADDLNAHTRAMPSDETTPTPQQ